MIKICLTIEFVIFIITTCVFAAHIIYMNTLLKELEKEINKFKDKNKEE